MITIKQIGKPFMLVVVWITALILSHVVINVWEANFNNWIKYPLFISVAALTVLYLIIAAKCTNAHFPNISRWITKMPKWINVALSILIVIFGIFVIIDDTSMLIISGTIAIMFIALGTFAAKLSQRTCPAIRKTKQKEEVNSDVT